MNPAIIAFLLQFNCHPTAAIVEEVRLPSKGAYLTGVVYLRPDADDGVLVHELVHDCQYKRLGPVKGSEDWFRRERQASEIERIWRKE